ncbi:MAG: heme lyase CcmF/NrfE family subunit [Chloroflexi bacterium]|nr:heme lyase CcmF/NrfE family subunit [Chloroflexota bacterium]
MLAEVGFIAAWLAFFVAVYSVFAALLGYQRHSTGLILSARNATYVIFGALTVALGTLMIALLSQDYQISYVWSVSNPSMPTFYRVTALWGSQAGSLLFWCWLLAAFSAASVTLNWRSNYRLIPHVIVFQSTITAFFLLLNLVIENPFNRFWLDGAEVVQSALIPAGLVAPSEFNLAQSARGLNPLLRHVGMAIHPPMLYLGFIGFLVPCAFAFAALVTGDLSNNWIRATRRWTLIAWVFLALGLILGGRWAYDVLGWGGYWGWDPVENAAFLPWLVGTAFLHSIMIQEKRGLFKTWNMFLIIATFSAVIFGTFATRSGLVESVHSFARSDIGFPMLMIWFTVTLTLGGLIVWRRRRGELRDDHTFSGIFSREGLFLLNNFVFLALFVVIFWGSFGAPISSELFFNTNITLGLEYFNGVTPWLFLALFVLMGIAPLSAWGASALARLGRGLVVPVILTVATLPIFILQGHTNAWSIVGYFFVLLAGWVAIYETYRALRARARQRGENPITGYLSLLQRNPRRYGGYLIHFGIVVIGVGVIGSTAYQQETQATLRVGESTTISDYTLVYDRFEGGQVAQDGRIMDIAVVSVWRNDQLQATLRPRRDFFPNQQDMNSMTIAGAHSTLENDFYVLLLSWDEISQNSATFKIYINPLINLVWWGGLILIVGTLAAMYPNAAPSRVESRVSAPDRRAFGGGRA